MVLCYNWKNSKKQDDLDRSLIADGRGLTAKLSRDDETFRSQEEVQSTIKKGNEEERPWLCVVTVRSRRSYNS